MISRSATALVHHRLSLLFLLVFGLCPLVALAQTTTVLDPTTFTRSSGEPVTESVSFEVSTPLCASIYLRLTNGDDDGKNRVSSAEIWINGVLVAGPNDFSQQVDGLTMPLTGLEFDNELSVRVASKPGSFVTIEIVDTADASVPPLAPVLDPFPELTAETTVVLSGVAVCATSVEISAPTGRFNVPAIGESFSADVPLRLNSLSSIHVTGISEAGRRSAPTVARVTQDQQPPNLFIDLPLDGDQLYTTVTDVAGRVGDNLSGYAGLTVTVNGVEATVNVGIGNNGTFLASDVPLAPGQPNVITAVAADVLGNQTTREIQISQLTLPPEAPRLEPVDGNGQTGEVRQLVPQPLTVRVTLGDGSPVASKLVTFDVVRSDGRLSADGSPDGTMTLQVRTDADGEASAYWRLGGDSGFGNNRVVVRSAGVANRVAFCASAEPAAPRQVNVGSGHMQRAEVGSPAPAPLVAWVSDGLNGVPGVPVTFRVLSGGGLVNGAPEATVLSSRTGHASVRLTLGLEPGNHRVIASFTGNETAPASFTTYGVRRDPSASTSFSGIVLDNAERAVGGARCGLEVNGVFLPEVFTDAFGRCSFSGIPDGAAHFFVDGLEATLLDGQPIPVGSFPALSYETVVVPNVANSLGTPVLLPRLDPTNAVEFDNTTDVVLTVDGVEGLSMLVKAGSMVRADGTIPSPADPAILTLNQVHHDDIPMPMPDGAAPPFAWTLQPAGAHFDPPIVVTYPNMSGLPPGSIAYFLSFNHGVNRFEIVASGSVSDDGMSILSDPGAGISTAGWGCNCPPYSVTAECESCSVTATLGDAEITAGGSESVTCTITNTSEGDCTFDWEVLKDSGAPTVNPMPPSGSVTLGPMQSTSKSLTLEVPANSSARNDAVMKLEVTGDASTSATGTVCVLPDGETSFYAGFNLGPQFDLADFRGQLTPTSANFRGRTVTENPVGSGTGTTDGCWFPGSAVPRYTNANSITGGTWTVMGSNTYGVDRIGFFSDLDGYYKFQGRTPCTMQTTQHMKILCPSGPVEYTTNRFVITVTDNGTTISRDGTTSPLH